jgi:hypothetical protein
VGKKEKKHRGSLFCGEGKKKKEKRRAFCVGKEKEAHACTVTEKRLENVVLCINT